MADPEDVPALRSPASSPGIFGDLEAIGGGISTLVCRFHHRRRANKAGALDIELIEGLELGLIGSKVQERQLA